MKTKHKDIVTGNDLQECLDCGHESYDHAEIYDNKGNEITSWNIEDNVCCPSCESFNFFIKQE